LIDLAIESLSPPSLSSLVCSPALPCQLPHSSSDFALTRTDVPTPSLSSFPPPSHPHQLNNVHLILYPTSSLHLRHLQPTGRRSIRSNRWPLSLRYERPEPATLRPFEPPDIGTAVGHPSQLAVCTSGGLGMVLWLARRTVRSLPLSPSPLPSPSATCLDEKGRDLLSEPFLTLPVVLTMQLSSRFSLRLWTV
jgi:hypothetical protein